MGVTTIYVTHDQAEALTMADRVAILRKGVLQDVGSPTQVYSRPGTLYVAAFLGSPRMNLLEASVYVHLDRYVALHLGEQTLFLPWNDMRARQVAHFHGERIVVGVRAEALTPSASDATGDVLHGRVRYLEHHGHESLAFLDVGAFAVPVEDVYGIDTPPTSGGSRLSRVAARFRRRPDFAGSAGTSPTATAVLDGPPGLHRARAELAVRLPPYPRLRAGEMLTVTVRVDQLHFFDGRGNRIDVGRR
jgi:multiple sugar transport system ATP-binding protein